MHLYKLFAVSFAAFLLAVPAASAEITQLTSHVQAGCVMGAPSASADLSLVSFESTCDLAAANADGNREIFQVDADGLVTQLTDTADCANANPSSNAVGDIVAYDTDCDDAGLNADGSIEIATISGAIVTQLTSASFCSSFAPAINAAGDLVAYDSDCDFLGTNVDLSNEIYRVGAQGVVTQLSADGSASGCGSFNASINDAGDRVTFDSDCDLTGSNEDQISEIFQAGPGGVTQLTAAADDGCLSALAASDSTGDTVAFESDCDYVASNGDGSVEIFTVDDVGDVVQVTDDDGSSACESTMPAISANGSVVSYSSFCDPTGDNGDGSIELFSAFTGTVSQLTDSANCSSLSPALSAGGTLVAFTSECNHGGDNADRGDEIFVADVPACLPCGAPASGVAPTASDALFILRVAVGLGGECQLCECDVNDDAAVSATDALSVLGAAVGQDVELTCPAP